MSEANNAGKQPVTLFFERPADGRVYRHNDWLSPEEISNRERTFSFCLARWGTFDHPHSLRFMLIVSGHVEILASSELLRQYLEKAMGPDAKAHDAA